MRRRPRRIRRQERDCCQAVTASSVGQAFANADWPPNRVTGCAGWGWLLAKGDGPQKSRGVRTASLARRYECGARHRPLVFHTSEEARLGSIDVDPDRGQGPRQVEEPPRRPEVAADDGVD